MVPPAAPIGQKERTIIVDCLRGFSLVGVLIANFTSFTEQQIPSSILHAVSSPIDLALVRINAVFFEWKFMTLFSILFGYGFGLLMASIGKRNISPESFFLRRMFWLFLIGFIHTSFWWFDVLHLYAVCGVLLLLFRKMSGKVILVSSLLFMFVLPFCLSLAMQDQPDTFSDADWQNVFLQFKHGNLGDVFKTNLSGYHKLFILSGNDIHDVVETLGRFLFGYYLIRIKVFESIDNKREIFRKILLVSSPLARQLTLKHWRCGGILCSVRPVPLLIKDTKAHSLFCCMGLFVGAQSLQR